MKLSYTQKQLAGVALFMILICLGAYYSYTHFKSNPETAKPTASAFNTALPANPLPQKEPNKEEIYAAAEKDSALKNEMRSRDPYIPHPGIKAVATSAGNLNLRLERLSAELDKPVVIPKQKSVQREAEPVALSSIYKQSVAPPTVDPEMQQLSGMLDKIIAIQHPQTVKAKTVITDSITVIKSIDNRTIQAVVHGDQILTSGATIKLRLLQDISINETPIPRGNFIYGICQLNSERLVVQLTNLIYNAQVYPFPLHVYDIDGIEGIYVPGAISREVSKDGADNAIQSLNIGSLDATITGQVTAAGIQTAKSLLSKKVKLIRVVARSGHKVLLQNPNAISKNP